MTVKQSEANRLANNLYLKFGLPVTAILQEGGQYICLTPQETSANESFQVKIVIGWRSLQMELLPGKFASDYLQLMASASTEKRQIFADIARGILDEKGQLNLKINDTVIDPLTLNGWPDKWKSVSFSLKKSPLEINTEDFKLTESLINLWVERFFGCIISLAPLEEEEINEDLLGYPEVSLLKVQVNRYERNRYNRTMCINFHGPACKVCGIDFGKKYGIIGEGFIHVHHTTPVSELGARYIINPIRDLVPVCPNCHSMLHKRKPPYSITELAAMLNSSGKSSGS